jgi:hypothetical protein
MKRDLYADVTARIVAELEAGAADLARSLWGRYCDFERLFHLAMAEYASASSTAAGPDQSNLATPAQPARSRDRRKLSPSDTGRGHEGPSLPKPTRRTQSGAKS